MKIILNDQQERAVKTDSKNVLCLAGAGSGKSRCIVERIAYLIEQKNISPYEILAQTFTRLAAKELVERLEKRIGPKAQKITCGTIHSVALNFIQKFGEIIGMRPGKITVYNSWESDFLLKETANDIGFHDGYKWVGVSKKSVYLILNKMSNDNMVGYEFDQFYKEIEIIDAFFARCKENNALTYDSILSTFLKLMPKLRQEYLGFKHVFVDECQDNNPIQWEITNTICKLSDASLFASGDFSQSVYQFRGADPGYLTRNQDSFDIFKLQKNYRSDANIVESANRLIEHNENRIPLEMIPVRKFIKESVQHLENIDSKKTVGLIKFLNDVPGINKKAVLSRNHFLLKKLSTLLEKAGIKHEYIGKKTGLIHSEEFRRFHAFLKLIVNPFDNFSFLLIKDIIAINQEEYRELRVVASEKGLSHFQAWREKSSNFVWMIEAKYSSMDTTIDWMKDIEFEFNTDEIFDFLYSWILDNPDKSIDQYLNWLTTYDIQDEIKKDPEDLQLMTCHASKGLEFGTVIIAGMNDGMFPDKRAKKIDPNVEDERNLAYVAMTRAENQLIFTSRSLKKDLFEIKNPVSRFISEALNIN